MTMERGRESRRGGSVSAPRRLRTGGLKDAPVSEDGDDVMDDIHNSRLRERPKKDVSVTAVQGITAANLGSVFRNKRKRQGSQELHCQGRICTADDFYESTEDTEMLASEDDDDLPPPPIPRRPGKLRLQGKLLEDGISGDLPAVPRKARTAILKRPPEASSSPVVDSSSHQGSTAIPRTLAPSSAPSSSSVVSLKPGRRTKHSNAKSRGAKVPKESIGAVVSEQEVEVAEALFDLARMFHSHPSVTAPEQEVIIDKTLGPADESKPKIESKAAFDMTYGQHLWGNDIAASSSCVDLAPLLPVSANISLVPTPSQITTNASLPSVTEHSPTATTSCPLPAGATLPVPAMTAPSAWPPQSTPSVTLQPPAEAPKRKRPRVRIRPDELEAVPQMHQPGSSNTAICISSAFPAILSSVEYEQCLASSPLKTECSQVPSALPIAVSLSVMQCSKASSAPDPVDSSPKVLVLRNIILEQKPFLPEKLINVDSSSTVSPEEQIRALDRRAATSNVLLTPGLAGETKQEQDSTSENNTLNELELSKKPNEELISAGDGSRSKKLQFDLMETFPPKPTLSPHCESTSEVSGNQSNDIPDKCLFGCVQKRDTVRGQECKKQEREGQGNLEGKVEYERQSNRDQLQNQEELITERDTDVELQKQFLLNPRRSLKAESRGHKTEGPASAVVSSTQSSILASSLPGDGSGSIPAVPVVARMDGWPLAMPPVGFYSSVAAVEPMTGVPGVASVDDNTFPTVQVRHPLIIQERQSHPWKRCASHVYIAHFIDVQQQMDRYPFLQAACQNSASLYGVTSSNLNMPVPPVDTLLGSCSVGPLTGAVSGSVGTRVVGCGNGLGLAIGPGSEKNLGMVSLGPNIQTKDRIYADGLSRKQASHQQQHSLPLPSNLLLQAGPGFGFPAPQAGRTPACSVAASPGKGVFCNPGSGGLSAVVGVSSALAVGTTAVVSSTVAVSGASSDSVARHAAAQAQYLEAVMQRGSFTFPFQAAAHFGHGFSGPAGHIGQQQAAQFFSSPFYPTHLVHSAAQQQMQQSANVSSGLGSVQNQHISQQLVRNFPSIPLAPSSQSPSHSPQQRSKGLISHHIQWQPEREGSNIGDIKPPTESKFPIVQRNYGHGNSSATLPSSKPPSPLLLGAGVHKAAPQDFNLKATFGVKPAKMQQLGQLISQQQLPVQQQHQEVTGQQGSAVFQMSLMDQQSSQTLAAVPVSAMNNGVSHGPGPLGLAPVAAVMAPQGHAMLQSISDSSRGPVQPQQLQHHQSGVGQLHQHAHQSGQQQQQTLHTQRAASVTSTVEDTRTVIDGNGFSSRSGRESVEDRKISAKRGMGSTLNLSRVELEGTNTTQAPACGGILTPRISGSVTQTLNLIGPATTIVLPHLSGHTSGSGPQQSGHTQLGNQNFKQTLPRSKSLGISGGPHLLTTTQSQMPSSCDKVSLGSSTACKTPGPPLTLSPQDGASGALVARPAHMMQSPQLKFLNRSSVGSSTTASCTATQLVPSATTAKCQQGPQQQHSRLQVPGGTSGGSQIRASSKMSGPLLSTSIPLPPPLGSKSVPTSAKSNLSAKGSYPFSHKASSGMSVKRSTPLILCPNPMVQGLASKSSLQQSQQQHNLSHHIQVTQPPSAQSLQPTSQPSQSMPTQLQHQQYHSQQAHISSQQLQQVHGKQAMMQQQQTHNMQRHIFLQSPVFHQHQHSPGSPLNSHPQQHSGLQQYSQQQPLQQVHQQTSSPSSQPQQLQKHSSPQLQQLQQYNLQQQNMQVGAGSFSCTTSNGSSSLSSPTLTLGTGSIGISNSSLQSCSDGSVAASQGSGSRSNMISGMSLASSNSQRCHVGGLPLVHNQFGCNVVEHQQLSSPVNRSGAQFLQPVSISGANLKLVEQKVTSDGNGQEQMTSMRLSSTSSSPSRMPPAAASCSPGLQCGPAIAATSFCKSGGGQSSGNLFCDGMGPHGGFMMSVAPNDLTSRCNSAPSSVHVTNGSFNSGALNSSVHLGSDGRPFFCDSSSASSEPAIIMSGSVHESSSLLMALSSTSDNTQNGQPAVLGQTMNAVQS